MDDRLDRKKRSWRYSLPAVVLAMALLVAACGDSDSGTESGSGSSADTTAAPDDGGGDDGGDDGPEGGVSAEVLAELQAEIDAAEAVPTWEAQGPEFSIADLAGKKILSMPVASFIEGCDNMAREVVEIAKSVGMEDSTYFQTDGGPDSWSQGMELALNQGYDGVALVCGIDPNALAPQMKLAEEAGMMVVDLHLADVSVPADPLISGQTNGEFNRAMRLGVWSSLIRSGGEPIDVFMITSNENPPSVGMEQTVYDEYARLCSGCNVSSTNVPIPDAGAKVPGTVSSALVANPDIKAFFVSYDLMMTDAVAEVKAAGTDTWLYAFGGDKLVVPLLADEANHMGSDTGPNFSWMAYSGADQLFRVMVGEAAIPADEAFAPYRMWTANNAGEVADEGEGFGTAYIDGYRSLWLDAP